MKIGIICFEFKESNLRKQPWRYIYEIAKGLQTRGHEVFVITDTKENTSIDGVRIISVNKLSTPLNGESREVLKILEKENPDKVIMLLGLTSLLRIKFKIEQPVIGILTSPIYSVKELVKNIGVADLIRYRRPTFIHIVNALIPGFLIKKWSEKFGYIVVLSNRNKERLIKKKVPDKKIVVIPPGIDEHFFDLPDEEKVRQFRNKISPDGAPIVMYYTSPLTLRGTDTLVKTLPHILKKREVRLLILSRPDDANILKEEQKLRELAKKLNVERNIVIASEYLQPDEIKTYLSLANVVALPFKLVLSDVPLSILEAMALGKVVISTDVDGIPEILEDKGLIVEPNNPKELADAILLALDDNKLRKELGESAREYMMQWKRWNDVVVEFVQLLR